jgi:CRISPR/Cas system CSM-associated protein Csm3 (group 7 of RAMP superfamily)
MKERLKIRIIIKSPALIGSGEGFGALIDSDIVFDDVGLPYIPAKRIKGCLRDSAKEVEEILDEANISTPLEIDAVFGQTGAKEPAQVFFSNLFIQEYEANQTWLRYFMEHDTFNKHITRESVQNHFTEIRQMTRIGEDGVSFDHSLRSVRLIKKGEIFEGDVHITGRPGSNDLIIQTLNWACMNFRRMGTNRNRGFGEISCTLDIGKRKFNMPEALCIN